VQPVQVLQQLVPERLAPQQLVPERLAPQQLEPPLVRLHSLQNQQ
jgi:hypothetical protein